MRHMFQQGESDQLPTLVLLHGTGGTEDDLLPLAQNISPHSSVLGVRGNVVENGMPRFFRRVSEGVFDLEDLVFRTKELNQFLNEASERYGFERDNVVALGYSNGANIATSLLFHYHDSLRGAILHHPMVPLRNKILPDLADIPVFIGAGTQDSLCSQEETKELAIMLRTAGALVDIHWEDDGHQITPEEINAAKEWFQQKLPMIAAPQS